MAGSKDIKSVFNPTGGYTDNYFGGQGKPDGPGHGHIRVDDKGNEQIVRDSYKPGEYGARKDATLLDSKTSDKRK